MDKNKTKTIPQYCFGCKKLICDIPKDKWKQFTFCKKCVLEIDKIKP